MMSSMVTMKRFTYVYDFCASREDCVVRICVVGTRLSFLSVPTVCVCPRNLCVAAPGNLTTQ
jgi:hypothetical protein